MTSRSSGVSQLSDVTARSGGEVRRTYTVHEVATWLGISANHCYQLANQSPPPFPVRRLGRRLVVPAAAFDAWLESADEMKA